MKPSKNIVAILLVFACVFFGAQAQQKGNLTSIPDQSEVRLDVAAQISEHELVLTFGTNVPEKYTVELVDITGKNIQSWTEENQREKCNRLNLNRVLPNSLYLVKITTNGHVTARKVQMQ